MNKITLREAHDKVTVQNSRLQRLIRDDKTCGMYIDIQIVRVWLRYHENFHGKTCGKRAA